MDNLVTNFLLVVIVIQLFRSHSLFSLISKNLITVMDNNAKVKAFVESVNASTNEIAADIKNWKAAYESNNITQETLDSMDAAAAKLKAMGDEDSPLPSTEEGGGEETGGGEGAEENTNGSTVEDKTV